ncbi:unnamed protein product [Nippostrongylus brasiliensis]|uniref:UBA domain-containing protein n=1 Tax=Nippostrongylus brasiliensis TaxID=27835 RepID=A0A3P7BPX0_NIPBR|nr:unnamed protein product [Nippostrongylus brasiliensis]
MSGSFIHAAHGDVLNGESWGTPDKIDDIYLKNPVRGEPISLAMNGVPVLVPSVADVSHPYFSSPNVHCSVPTSSKIRDPLAVDWSDAFDAAAFDEGLGLTSSTSSYPPQSLPSSSNLSASRPVISSSTVPSKPQQENGSTSIMASIMGQLRVDTTKPMPNVSAPGRSQEPNVPNESDVGLVHRRVSSQPILDENRRSRVQSEIFNALPPPSSLFFGSTTNIAANHVTTATSTPKPKVESHNNTVSDAPSSSSSSSSSSKPALSIEGVLQPIRLPIGGVNPVTRPPAAPVAEFRPTSVVNPQNPTLVIPQQATIQHTPVSMQRQLPLYSVSNNAIRFGMPPTYGTGPLTLPNRGYAATPYGNGLPVWGSSTLPPRLDPVTPFRIGENEDIIEALDPLLSSSRTQRSTNGQQSTNGISGISRAQEMEILYSDAPFADHSRCDRMVASCQGNIEAALKELKIEHLIETQIASSREAAMRALTSKAWDLNAAAELLLTST